VCPPRRLDWLLRAGDICVGAAVATWTASGSTDYMDVVHAKAFCLPDPVFGSCAGPINEMSTSAECMTCASTVLVRDTTLGADAAAQEEALAAACGTPACTEVANADAATLTCTDGTDSQVTACLAGFSLCESVPAESWEGTESCAYDTMPDTSADLCVRVPAVVAGSCADFDAIAAADAYATSPTACTSVTPPPPRPASRRRRHPMCLSPRVFPRRPRLDWLLRAGDTCVRDAQEITGFATAAERDDLGIIQAGCYPDPVVGSCAGQQPQWLESAECLACRFIVEHRDPTLVGPGPDYSRAAAYDETVNAACGTPDPVPDPVPDTPAKASGAGVIAPLAALIAVVAMQ